VRWPEKEALCRCPQCDAQYELALDLDRWVLKKPGTQAAESLGLVWFELHLSPTEFRLAVAPGQPVFFADTPSLNPTQHKVVMLPNTEYEVLGMLSKMVFRDTNLFSLPQHDSDWAFTPQALQGPSFHLRMQSSTGERWVSVYPMHQIPPEVWNVFEHARRYMNKLATKKHAMPVSDQMLRYHYAMQMYEDAAVQRGAIARVKVSEDGYLFLDGNPVSDWHELDVVFQRLHEAEGLVFYYRENLENNPSMQVEQIAQAVIQRITEAQVPVKLVTEDFA
jgi:hypothetical protein